MTYLCGNLQMPIKVWGKMQAARTCHFAKIPRRFLGGDLHLLRQREVRHFLRGVQYWPYAHKVMWKVPHLSSGKRQSLSPVSTTSSLLPSFTTHWTKIGFWRLISLTWNFTGKNAISDGSSSIQSSPKNPILFERSLTNFPKNSNIPLAAEIHNGEWLYRRLWQKKSIWFSVQHWWAAHSTLLFFSLYQCRL